MIPALERDGVGGDREHAVSQEDAARSPVGDREEVAVDADRRGLRGQPPLHRGDGLPPDDRLVREDGPQAIEPDGARAADDVDRNRPVRRELDAPLVRGAGEERRGLSSRRRHRKPQAEERGERGEEREAEHGRTRVAEGEMRLCRVLHDPNSEPRDATRRP